MIREKRVHHGDRRRDRLAQEGTGPCWVALDTSVLGSDMGTEGFTFATGWACTVATTGTTAGAGLDVLGEDQ